MFNDGAFGNVRRIQQEHYGNRLIACDLANPDFRRVRRKLRRRSRARAQIPRTCARALRRAFAHRDGPTLIEVPVGAVAEPWEFIQMAQNPRRCSRALPYSGLAIPTLICTDTPDQSV